MKNKVLSIVLCAVLMLSTVGCGGEGSVKESMKESDPTELKNEISSHYSLMNKKISENRNLFIF